MKTTATTATPPAPSPADAIVLKITKQQMKRWVPIVLGGIVAVVLLTGLSVWAFSSDTRPHSFGEEALYLLTQESVQKELQATEEQVAKAAKIEEDRRAYLSSPAVKELSNNNKKIKGYQQSRVAEKALAKVLDKEQMKRLKQIALQQLGKRDLTQIFHNDEVAQALKLTKAQQDEITAIQDKYRKESRAAGQGRGQRGGAPAAPQDEAQKEADAKKRKEQREKAEEMRKAHEEQLLAVLDVGQQNTWQEMLGEPFTGEIAPRGGPGGQFGPGAQAGPGGQAGAPGGQAGRGVQPGAAQGRRNRGG